MVSILPSLYQFGSVFAFLVIISIGLAIIFGVMNVINLAHGEFIMWGAYITVICNHMGIPLAVAIALGALGSGLAGVIVELILIKRLYARPIDTIVATWGLSLIMSQGTLIVAGPQLDYGVSTPFGHFSYAGVSFSVYNVVLMVVAAILVFLLYLFFARTGLGRQVRATMQDEEMASSLGINTRKIYLLTFGLGTALAGLAGGLYAPTVLVAPNMGASFIVDAFVTVVVGGASDALLGVGASGALLGAIKASLTGVYGQTIGEVGLLVAVIVIVRFFPDGISRMLVKRQ